MNKIEKKFKYLLLIPVLGATTCLGIVYLQRDKYEKITLKIIYGYMLMFFILMLVSFGFSVLISYILGIKNGIIGLSIMWMIAWILLDISFINMYKIYLQD